MVLTLSEEGRTRLRSLAEDDVERVRELTRRYQRFRGARAELVKLTARMVKTIDAMERLRRVKP